MPQRTVALLLADGFEEIEAIAPADILRRAGFHVVLLAVGDDPLVVGARQIAVQADQRLADFKITPRAAVFPGGMPGAERLGASVEARALARRVFLAGGVLGAICAAPAFTLGPWKFLDGKRATCYPGFETRLPSTTSYTETAVVVDGGMVTARGPGVALPFAYALVELLAGADAAAQLRADMRFPPADGGGA